jgi:simple sugar transport system permease protein
MFKNFSFANIMAKLKSLSKTKGSASFFATLLAIAFGLLFGLLVLFIASPANTFGGFGKILFGGFDKIGDVLYFATPILMTGLAVGFAFKMGLFNIGASGQYTMGMFFAIYVGFMIDMPSSIHWIVAILAGLLGGMIMGLIPGILKAFFNVNEVITSIMLNYIGMFLVDMWISNNDKMYVSSLSRTKYLPESVQLASLNIQNSNANIGLFFAISIAVILYVVLHKTTFGYELIATGHNKDAAKYAGINFKRNTVLTMVIAGGLAGLGGAFAILAPSTITGSSMTYEPVNIIAINGFNGIAVALLGNSNPVGIIFSALFISHIQRGGTAASLFGYKPEIIDVVISVIIYFSAFSLIMSGVIGKFFKNLRKKRDKTDSDAAQLADKKEVS